MERCFLAGKLSVKMPSGEVELQAGDLIHLTSEIPNGWSNPGPDPARLFWIKIK